MKKSEFVTKLSEYCEFGNNNYPLDTLFESIEEYDSLAVMTIIAFVDEHFKMSLATEQLREITDFNSLIALIGEDKFEND